MFSFAPYSQDDWKLNSSLTLNLGLRWDFRAMPYETNDHFGWWNSSSPRGGVYVADRKLQEAGILGDGSFHTYAGRRTPHDASKNVWAPRFSISRIRKTGIRSVISSQPSRSGLQIPLIARSRKPSPWYRDCWNPFCSTKSPSSAVPVGSLEVWSSIHQLCLILKI